MLCQVHRETDHFHPPSFSHKSFMRCVTCCPILLHPHHQFLLSCLLCLPLPLLDLLFSLVRVRTLTHAPERADSALLQGCIYQGDKALPDNSQVSQGLWPQYLTSDNKSHKQLPHPILPIPPPVGRLNTMGSRSQVRALCHRTIVYPNKKKKLNSDKVATELPLHPSTQMSTALRVLSSVQPCRRSFT